MKKQFLDYYVLLALDEDSATAVTSFKMLEKNFKLPYKVFYPHMTIAHFPLAEKKQITKAIKKISKKYNAIDIDYAEVKLMKSSLLALRIDNTNEIKSIYNDVHTSVDAVADMWTSPSENKFVPHVSLYFSKEIDLTEMFEHVKQTFKPFSGKVVAIELSQFDGKTYTITHRFPLKKRWF